MSVVDSDKLVYPKQVIDELDWYKTKGYDRPLEWAKSNSTRATRHGELFAELSEVMNHPIANKVCDPNKSFGPEEADPYVLALALHLKASQKTVTVITEESKTTPNKLALNQACGALRIYSVKVEVFLQDQGIFPSSAPKLSQGPQKKRSKIPK